ncbi:hypothetical protein FJT64_010459 [Amphibalanus amphitrite]|uniref:Uncharacterized protein n=2 Tax=Amphibalanus amphitrite TaxID=1232801 RepID=A0A6A4VJ87_AMPAM|nr:hypothetical protein FJT64_010459 [Amphibalanus amphitrite]
MESAGKVYAQNPDPDTKLGDLETMELSKLKILQTRYKSIVGNRALLSRLRDRGESARRTLAAVEAELAARGAATEPGPPPLESRAASEVERLAQRMAQMEWDTGRRTVSAPVELDSDDDSEPEAEWPTAGGPSEGEEPRRAPAAADNCTA